MKLILTEKPSVAKDLARVFNATIRREGYLEGNDLCFSWAFGHLIQLAYPEDYGVKEWNEKKLPILPQPFKLTIKRKKGTRGYKDDPGVKKQLKVISELVNACSEIIVATDAGREGELIFRYIYEYLRCTKPFTRLWISSQTDRSIRDGFSNLRNGTDYDNLFAAAQCRSRADWLVGINCTQALSLSQGNGLYSIGRVQTPTLVMICDRYLEHKNFKPKIYFQLSITLEKNGIRFKALSPTKHDRKEDAQQILTKVKTLSSAIVKDARISERTEPPPLLYDLTTLQQDANKKYGLPAAKTLDIAQKLYEQKSITYPRTGSRYIGDDVFAQVPALIGTFSNYPRFTGIASALAGKSLSIRSVNASKVTDHHALLPTEQIPAALAEGDRTIYELIVGRMLEAFSNDCVKENIAISLSAHEDFLSKGSVIKVAGWRAVFNEVENEVSDEHNPVLPPVKVGESINIIDYQNLQKTTRPNPLHTEASLLKAMETCGHEIEDESAREAMKDSGLGTPATRASIIETLFDRTYISREKKSLIPTAKGISVFHLVKDLPIGSAGLTGEWEKQLAMIERGKLSADIFQKKIEDYTIAITKHILEQPATNKSPIMEQNEKPVTCPKCKTAPIKFVDNPKLNAAVCTAPREECGFIVFRTIANKSLTDDQLVQLLTSGKTNVIKGFRSVKTGNTFEAALRLDETFKTVFDFPQK